jgi:hypothetical protein
VDDRTSCIPGASQHVTLVIIIIAKHLVLIIGMNSGILCRKENLSLYRIRVPNLYILRVEVAVVRYMNHGSHRKKDPHPIANCRQTLLRSYLRFVLLYL